MALRLGELTAVVKVDDRDVEPTLARDKAKFRAAGQTMSRDAETSGREAGTRFRKGASAGVDGFFRDARGRLHGENDRFIREFEQLGEAAGGAAGGAGGAGGGIRGLAGAFSGLGDAFGSVSGGLKIFAIILGILIATATFAAPVIAAVAGAIASLPALALGAAAAIGTLVIGMSGLADHFKKTTKAGGSFVDRAYQLIQAQRRLRDANKEATASQVALTKAREDAAKQLRDLTLAVTGAQLDQHEATLRLTDAQKELTAAQESGDADRIERAQLAYDQAALAAQEAANRVGDLRLEHQRAAAAGVEGSDQVTSALDRQRHAVEGIQDAEHALDQTRHQSAGGGASTQLEKISKNAQAFVAAVKGLGPAWTRLRLSVQDKLFAGVSDEVKDLAKAWLPVLTMKLGNFASTFNSIFKTFASTSQKPEFIDKVGRALDTVDRLIGKVGKAFAGPFTDAMATLADAAKPFIDALGDELAGFFTGFAKWIDSGSKSGKLQSFMDSAGQFLREVFDLGGDVAGILGDITSALIGAEKDSGKSAWDQFRDSIKDLRAWLDDPTNQKKVQVWIDKFEAMGTAVIDTISAIARLANWLHDMEMKFEHTLDAIRKQFSNGKDFAIEQLDKIVGFVKGMPVRIAIAAVGMFDGIRDAFRSAINWIIDRWNSLHFTLPEGEILGQKVGGGTLSVPPIPHLKDGALVPATPGGRLVRLAEGGVPEAVMPLSSLAPMLRDAVMQAIAAAGAAGGRVIELTVDLGEGIKQVVQVHLDRNERHTVRVVGMGRGR